MHGGELGQGPHPMASIGPVAAQAAGKQAPCPHVKKVQEERLTMLGKHLGFRQNRRRGSSAPEGKLSCSSLQRGRETQEVPTTLPLDTGYGWRASSVFTET